MAAGVDHLKVSKSVFQALGRTTEFHKFLIANQEAILEMAREGRVPWSGVLASSEFMALGIRRADGSEITPAYAQHAWLDVKRRLLRRAVKNVKVGGAGSAWDATVVTAVASGTVHPRRRVGVAGGTEPPAGLIAQWEMLGGELTKVETDDPYKVKRTRTLNKAVLDAEPSMHLDYLAIFDSVDVQMLYVTGPRAPLVIYTSQDLPSRNRADPDDEQKAVMDVGIRLNSFVRRGEGTVDQYPWPPHWVRVPKGSDARAIASISAVHLARIADNPIAREFVIWQE